MDCEFQDNQISIDIEVHSPVSTPELPIKNIVKVLVDTGFTGDLQLTYQQAFPLGLSLIGIGTMTIADGTNANYLQCIGNVSLDKNKVLSSIDVKANGSPLIGVSLLRKLGCTLEVDFLKNKAKIKFTKSKSK